MFGQGRLLITHGEPRQAAELPRRGWQVFTGAGPEREAAVVMGAVVGIARRRRDYDWAAELQRKRLEVGKQPGDLDGIAGTGYRRPGGCVIA